jgi:hypothetical protein
VTVNDDNDADIRDALAQVLGEKKIRVVTRATRIRQLILYTLLILLLAYVTTISVEANRNQKALIATCYATQANTRSFNALVDRVIATYRSSPVLSPEQRKTRIALFAGAKQAVPHCPPFDRR